MDRSCLRVSLTVMTEESILDHVSKTWAFMMNMDWRSRDYASMDGGSRSDCFRINGSTRVKGSSITVHFVGSLLAMNEEISRLIELQTVVMLTEGVTNAFYDPET